jgi:SAM-dependent methyltransferase
MNLRAKQVLQFLYEPSTYIGFNEGISVSIFPRHRTLRWIFGWKPLAALLRDLGTFAELQVNSRIVEVPHLWMGLGAWGEGIHSVLDFGCVESKIAVHLANLGYSVTAVDLRDWRLRSMHPNIRYIQGNIFCTPLGGPYDLVVALSTVEHVGLEAYGESGFRPEGDKEVMAILRGVLKEGGLMYLTVPYGREARVERGYRVYDSDSLQALVEGLDIVRNWIYVSRAYSWCLVSAGEDIGSSEDGVAVLWLRKP